MRRGTIGTAICGIPCEIVYEYGDPLPAMGLSGIHCTASGVAGYYGRFYVKVEAL